MPSSTKPSISKINVDNLVVYDPLKFSNLFNESLKISTKVGHSIARAIDNTDDVNSTTYSILGTLHLKQLYLLLLLPTEILN